MKAKPRSWGHSLCHALVWKGHQCQLLWPGHVLGVTRCDSCPSQTSGIPAPRACAQRQDFAGRCPGHGQPRHMSEQPFSDKTSGLLKQGMAKDLQSCLQIIRLCTINTPKQFCRETMVPTLCVSQSFLIEELPVPNFLSSLMGGGYKPGGFDRGKQRCPSASCGQRAMQSCVLGKPSVQYHCCGDLERVKAGSCPENSWITSGAGTDLNLWG